VTAVMKTVRLGPLHVSRVGLGCDDFGGRLDLEATRAVVDAALNCGVTCFDTEDHAPSATPTRAAARYGRS